MYREVSDLSFGSLSEEEETTAAVKALAPASSRSYGEGQDSSWKTYTNNLEDSSDAAEEPDEDEPVQESTASTDGLPHSRTQVRFNTVFESSQVFNEQDEEEPALPTTWSACDTADLGIVATHLAAAALPQVQQAADHSHAAASQEATALLRMPLETEDMLGLGTLDLRSCTLRQAPAFMATQRHGVEVCSSRAAQVQGSPRMPRIASVFRYGSSVGDQLQALVTRPGKSFSGGLRFKPRAQGINFSDLKKQVQPDGADFQPETYLSRLHQHTTYENLKAAKGNLQQRTDDHHNQVKQMMKEHLKGVSSSLVLIDDIHLYVLKAEGPAVQNRRSDNAHKSIDKVQAAACSVFDGIIERQALVEKARQENQLAARYKSVLGFSARLQAFCKSSQYGQVLPAYQQATALIQAQATADVQSTVDWSVLQSLVDQALARTSADVLSQLTEGRDTGLQLDSGLHLLLHLQLRFPNGMDNQTSQPCCLNSFINAKAKRAKNAIAQCLAEWRTQGPASPHAATAVPAMLVQDEELDEEFEAMAATAMLHHMTPTQAMDQAALLVSEQLLPCMVQEVQALWLLAGHHLPALARATRLSAAGLTAVQEDIITATAAVQALIQLCQRHLGQLLEGLKSCTKDATAAIAAKVAACLLQMTKAFAETQASLETQALPSQFSNVIEDAGRQCAAMCIECACRQVQASHLRLATSDLFDAPSGPASDAPGSVKAVSSLESRLTALLHSLHRLCKMKRQEWLLPHVPLVWDMLFAAFEAFCQACHQLCSSACAASAQEEQQQEQQQAAPVQQATAQHVLQPELQQTVAGRIASYNAMAKAMSETGTPGSSAQQHTAAHLHTPSAAQSGKASQGKSGSCQLLMVLNKTAEMENVLACLVPGFLSVLSFEGSQQDREARAVQCESDLTFQRGQVQQSYIGTVCVQLQRHMGHYFTMAPHWQAVPQGVQEGAVQLLLTLVEVQADMLALAPHSSITQVMRAVVKQAVLEWHQQAQAILADAGLCAALQLSFDLHYLEASLLPYTTPAAARLLQSCHSTLSQAVTHCLCGNTAQCKAVQQVLGDHTSAQSVAAWLSKLGKDAVEQAFTSCSFSHHCLADGAAVGLAATSASQPSGLTSHACSVSGLSHGNSDVELPASPRRRLLPNKPVSYVHSRLIGMTSTSAAALASLQGKYGMQNVPSTPRSPAIKAHHTLLPQSVPSSRGPSLQRVVSHAPVEESEAEPLSAKAVRQLPNRPSRPRASGSNESRLGSNSRTGSLMGQVRHGRHKPTNLQSQTSITLTAMAALSRPPRLQIPP